MKQHYLSKLAILIAVFSGLNLSSFAQTTTFNYTGAMQTFSVPAGVTSYYVDMKGGCGGGAYQSCGSPGPVALAGRVQCNLSVTPGQILYIYVGGFGQNDNCGSGTTGGWNGGVNGGAFGAASGGGTDIRVGGTAIANRLVVAGGGGGGGDYYGQGGAGGGLVGAQGAGGSSGTGGSGGTQTGPGPVGVNHGTLGAGGALGSYDGGGGGYWGGNSGASGDGGGGGGSSYTDPVLCSAVIHTQGYAGANGNGSVTICPGPQAGTISGNPNICVGTSTTLTDLGASTTGTWSSTSALINVNASTGVVTGVATGSATVTYTVLGSCTFSTVTYAININGIPSPITGPVNVCSGSSIGLSDPDGGGTWLSSNTTMATIGSVSGVVNGLAAGTPFITFTSNATGCQRISPISVNSLPYAYNVSPAGGNYCAGTTTGVAIGINGSSPSINYQLWNGSTMVGSAVVGSGPAINFGYFTATGTYSVSATDPASGCTNTMNGIATVGINPAPNVNNVIVLGGGSSSYCAGGTGVHIGLNGSMSGANYSYQLYNNGAAIGAPIIGTGSGLDYSLHLEAGVHTVIATNTTTGCTSNMAGSVNVSINPLPPTNNVTNGGSYCAGGTGVSVGLNGSTTGINYQLYNTTTSVYGPTLAGSGTTLSYNSITTPGNYTIIGTNPLTNCSQTMSSSAIVSITPLPNVYNVNGTGSFCAGGTGLPVTLSSSDMGVNYQLYHNGVLVPGAVMAGTGSMISFGLQTINGNYTVAGTNAAAGCTSNMAGGAMININSLPVVKNMTGGGQYCAGGTGQAIGLNGSVPGVNYQLWSGGVPVGAPVSGTGVAISFGMITAPGVYTASAMSATTGCTSNMAGTETITVNPLPYAVNVTGGGNYCSGSTGVMVGTDSSEMGTSYQLSVGGVPSGLLSGTGSGLNFGTKTNPGSYTVVATYTVTGCSSAMAGAANIAIDPLPATFPVTGGGSYCTGGAGVHVGLGFASTGINYSLMYHGMTVAGPTAGLGAALDFGLQDSMGAYTVVASNISTGCSSNMTGSAMVNINPLPTVYNVSGGGNYCVGGNGEHVGVTNSTYGIKYQLWNGGVAPIATLTGTGASLDFGLQTAAGSYTVVALNASTGCTNLMSGTAPIAVNPNPNINTVIGGGSYCAGGSGMNIGLDSSISGINYMLYDGTTLKSTMGGTNSLLSFGAATTVGVYHVVAVDATTGCTSNMSGTATITVIPLPIVYTVTGGGSFCAGGAGSGVSLDGSSSGVNYELWLGGSGGTLVTTVLGGGGPVNFGLQTLSGNYTVLAVNATTGCQSDMASSATITINPNPVIDTVTGSGSYCAGGTGLDVALNGSTSGIQYQLWMGTTPVGLAATGTGSMVDFGMKTAAGNYTVSASNPVTGCTSMMASSANITITPLVVPTVTAVAGIPTTVCAGTMGGFTATGTAGGSTPSFTWTVNGMAMGTDTSYFGYTPMNGDVITVTLTSNAPCATPASVSSSPIVMTVMGNETPAVSIAANTADTVCQGTYVLFSAMPTNGGSAAAYTWIKNTAIVGSGLTYSTVVSNGDAIYAIMASSYPCLTTATDSVNSATINMNVMDPVAPSVTVSANPGVHVKSNTTVTFTAVATGTVSAPLYQWAINTTLVPGATNSTYTTTGLSDGANVTCMVESSDICGTGTGTGSVQMSVINAEAVAQISTAGSNVIIAPNPSKGMFTVKGSLGTINDQEVSIEITDMLGQVVYTTKVMANNGNINELIQLGNSISNGNYILNLRSGTENSVYHIVVAQ